VFAGGDFDLEEIVARAAADDLSGLVGDDVLDVLILARLDRFTDIFEFFVFDHDNLPVAAKFLPTYCFFVFSSSAFYCITSRRIVQQGRRPVFSEEENTP
jgi:hypothetical protein